MTEPAQPLDLAPIKARVDAARSGPWRLYDDLADDGYPGHLWTVQNRDDEPGDNGIVVSIGTRSDGEFLAHARQDVPALIAEVERLRAELTTVRAATFREAARVLEDTGRDDDAVNLLDNIADGITANAPA